MSNLPYAACVVILFVVAVQAIDWTKPCKEGDQWKDSCHTCHCSNGRPVCTRELCPDEANTVNMPTPLSAANNPAEKTSCTPGEKWKEDCNNCICDKFGEPECSRRLCGKSRVG